MIRLTSKLTTLALFGLLLGGSMACQRDLTPETGCGFMQNPDVQRVSWKSEGLPINLYIHESVPQEAYPAISAAIEVYTKLLGKKAFTIRGTGTSGSAGAARDGYSVLYWMDDWDPERAKEQGRTTVYWSGNRIYEADMAINNAHQFHYSQNTESIQGVDLTSLLVHEMGHMLGLDHNHNDGSVMNTTLAEGTPRTALSEEDQRNLSCEYKD